MPAPCCPVGCPREQPCPIGCPAEMALSRWLPRSDPPAPPHWLPRHNCPAPLARGLALPHWLPLSSLPSPLAVPPQRFPCPPIPLAARHPPLGLGGAGGAMPWPVSCRCCAVTWWCHASTMPWRCRADVLVVPCSTMPWSWWYRAVTWWLHASTMPWWCHGSAVPVPPHGISVPRWCHAVAAPCHATNAESCQGCAVPVVPCQCCGNAVPPWLCRTSAVAGPGAMLRWCWRRAGAGGLCVVPCHASSA